MEERIIFIKKSFLQKIKKMNLNLNNCIAHQKNIIESNSVKNLTKKRNFTKNTYLKLNFDNLKNEK